MIGATLILGGTLTIAAHTAHWARADRLRDYLYTAAILLMVGAGSFQYPEVAAAIAAAALLAVMLVVAVASLVVWWGERR